ncbi:MAG: hypothetical protein GX050_06680 [Firmicutes bacterium]|nr:hypothetical protein [Bacillota bacterium]
MTSRERILTVLGGGIPDRVPVGLFVQEEYLGWFFPEKKKVDRVKDAVECAQILGFDLLVRDRAFESPHFMKRSYTNWEVNESTKKDKGNFYRIFEIATPDGVLKQVEVGPYDERTGSGIHLATIEYLIKDEKDLEIFQKYIPRIDRETVAAMKERASFSRELIGDLGISAPWSWGGVFNQAATYRNVQDLLMDAYINPGFYQSYMETMTDLIIEFNSALAEAEFDCIGIQGNIANSAMVGPDYFEQFILPYEKKLVDTIKGAGKFTLYHNCGKAQVLQNSYVKLGIDMWETVAAPPQGDNDLKEAKAKIGDKLTLSGNLDQVDFLKRASLKEVEEKVTEIMHIGKPGGRYIFAASDFLEQGTPLENVKKVIEVAKREGVY